MKAAMRREAERLAAAVLAYVEEFGVTGELRNVLRNEALTSFCRLTSKRPRTVAEKASRAAKESRRQTKKEHRAAVREAVMHRANLMCECGCGRWFRGFMGEAQLDHFEGRARSESTHSCWALRADCHQAKTLNQPSAAHWLRKFIAHADRHGYRAEANRARARFEAEKLVQQAAEVSR